MSKIIVLVNPGEGHFNPFSPILKELIKRSHDVVCVAGKRFEDAVAKTGATFHPYTEQWDHSNIRLYEMFPGMRELSGIAQVKYYLTRVRHDPAADVVRDLQHLLSSFPADLIIYDYSEPAGLLLAELGGPPAICVSVLPYPVPYKGHAPFGLGLLPGNSLISRKRNSLLNRFVKRFVYRDVDRYYNSIRTRLGLNSLEQPLLKSYLSPDLFLQMSISGFEYPRTNFPDNFRFIGTTLLSKKEGFIKPQWWSDLTSDRPVVLINQGTVNCNLNNLIKPAIEALSKEKVLVLALPVAEGEIHDLPDNVRTAPYVPFGDLLPHVDIMITNGGFGGTQNALAHGIPLVISGTTEDKMEVAARVEYAGAGLNLRKQSPRPSKIRSAVRRILSDPSYRQNAKRLQAEYAGYDPGKLTADYAESFIKSKASSAI